MSAPTLTTERLILRGFEPRDLDRIAQSLADPKVYEHLSGRPSTREESWRRMLAGPGLWALLGYGYWAVERREDGLLLGQVGFADFKRAIEPSIEGVPEIGWILSSDAHGRGYGSEAVAAALAWADASLDASETVCIIAPANLASIRVAEKAGYGGTVRTTYQDAETLLLRRPQAQRGRVR